jgi:preprotein translocase subunit YajC
VQLFYYGDFQKMLISPAFAQSAGGGGDLTSLLPFVLIFVVFYFFLIRPQQKRAKEHREMVSQLRRGDKVITSGGLVGTVTKSVDDQETVEVEIAKDVRVNIMRTMIADKRSKGDKKNAAKAEEPKKSGLAGLFGGGKK